MEGEPLEVVETFESLTLFGRRWYFRIVDTRNHEILTPSQGYKSPAARDKTAKRFARRMGTYVVEGMRR